MIRKPDPMTYGKTMARSLIDSNDAYRRLIESVHLGVYIADNKGILVYANQAFVDILGYNNRDEFIGFNFFNQLYAHPEDRKIFLERMEKVGFVRDYEILTARKDGTRIVLSITGNLIRDEHERIVGMEGIVSDVTEKRKLENSLTNEKDKLELIVSFDQNVSVIDDLEKLHSFVVERVSEILESQRCSLMILDRPLEELKMESAVGVPKDIVSQMKTRVEGTIAGFVVQTGQPLLVRNIEYDSRFHRANKSYYRDRSFMVAPIKVGDAVIGVINVTQKQRPLGHEESYTDTDLKLLSMMSQKVGITIDNISKHAVLRQFDFDSQGSRGILETLIQAIEHTADHVMITNRDSVIQYVNPAFEKTTGYTKEDVSGKTPRILKSGKQGSDYYHLLWSTILKGEVFKSVTVNKKKNGELFYADQTISPVKNYTGEITHFISVWKDTTERNMIERRLQQLNEQVKFEKEKLEQILGFDEKIGSIRKFDQLIDFIVEKTARIMEADQCLLMMLDQDSQELRTQGAVGFKEEDVKKIRVHVGEHIVGCVAEDGQAVLVSNIETDERFLQVNKPGYFGKSFMVVPIKIEGRVIGVIAVSDRRKGLDREIFDDIDLRILMAIAREVAVAIENVKLYKELNYLAIVDPLTQAYNFRYFTKTLDYEIERAKRFSGNLCLLMLDVDGLKPYNDTYGHLEGDHLLKEVAKALQAHLRHTDILCRYAGDEFVAILPETDQEGAMIAAEKIRQAVASLKLLCQVTVSMGIVSYSPEMTRHDMTAKVDRALYQAKHDGRNRVCFFG